MLPQNTERKEMKLTEMTKEGVQTFLFWETTYISTSQYMVSQFFYATIKNIGDQYDPYSRRC